jgi:glyoxylase-like metal-dependent hydrolase (beta-lactamase superfamily II)
MPTAPRPLLARLTTRSGPPEARHLSRAGAEVLVVPCRYSVTYVLLGRRAAIAVDVGSIADVPRILDALRWIGRSPAELRTVLPSHLHFDHVMGVDALARSVGASVALARPAWEHVVEGRPLRFPSRSGDLRSIATWPMQGMPFPPLADWVHGLDFGTPWGRDRFTARLGPVLGHGSRLPGLPGWKVLLTPGHSDDSLCLYHDASGILVAGDTVRNFYGGEWNPLAVDAEAYERSREQLCRLDVSAILPAHGPVIEGPGLPRWLLRVPYPIP